MPRPIPDEVIVKLANIEAYLRELVILAECFSSDIEVVVPQPTASRLPWPAWALGSCDPVPPSPPERVTTAGLLENTIRPAWEETKSVLDAALTLNEEDPEAWRSATPVVLRPRPISRMPV